MNKKIFLALIIIVIFALSTIGVNSLQSLSSSKVPPHATPFVKPVTTLRYKGEKGKNALILLKEHATIQQDHSGLVVSIDGNKPTGHNYWEFYVNGKSASVGPANYVTKNSDVIMWKVEKY